MSSQIQLREESDTIYWDCVMGYHPNSLGDSPAIYQQQLTQPIVYNPKNYFLAVVRFSVPGRIIPIFVADILPYPNTDLNKTIYSFTLVYGGNTVRQYIEYISTTPTGFPPLPITPTHPRVDRTQYYYVYTYTIFIEMMNNALLAAFNALPTKPPTVGSNPPAAPYFVFDPITYRITLWAQQAYYDQALSTSINIYCNNEMFRFLDGIRVIYNDFNDPNGSVFKFDVRLIGNPNPNSSNTYPPAYINLTQEYPTLNNWNDMQSIQFISNLLPINREFIPNVLNSSASIVNSKGILADFIPIYELGPEARTIIQYVQTGPWRYIDMFGTAPISRIDINVVWNDARGNSYPVYIPENQNVSIKLLFIKKKYAGLSTGK